MVFRKRKEEPLEIMLRNEIIPYKESTELFGMTQDSKLNQLEHINKLRAKAKRALSTIKVVAGKKWRGDRKTLKNCKVQYVEQKQNMAAKYTIQPLQED